MFDAIGIKRSDERERQRKLNDIKQRLRQADKEEEERQKLLALREKVLKDQQEVKVRAAKREKQRAERERIIRKSRNDRLQGEARES